MADTTHSREQPTSEASDESVSVDGVGATKSTCRVGVLSTHNSKETKAILNAVRALGHDPVWLRDENVRSRIVDGTVRRSPGVDVLVNRLLVTKSDQPLEDLHLARLYADTVPVLNPPDAVETAFHKYRAGVALADAGLPVPDAYFGRSPRTVDAWSDYLPGTAAHKQTVGKNGRAMSVVSSGEAVNPTIRNSQSFLQEFLESGAERPSDVRVYVVGDQVVGAMRRRAPPGEWRTNVALGGDVAPVTADLGERPRRIAVEATEVLGLDVAGVDLMEAGGEWYVLEVNATAGFRGLYEATSVSPAPYIAGLALERVGVGVRADALADLVSELDDSVPDCKPPVAENASENGVLGFTESVRVSGTGGTESAVAKADTGASRTSLDTELAGRIGAGPLVGTTQVRSVGRAGTETRPLVDVQLRVGGGWRTVTASVTDRGDMTYPVLLGRDVLEEFRLDVSRRVEE